MIIVMDSHLLYFMDSSLPEVSEVKMCGITFSVFVGLIKNVGSVWFLGKVRSGLVVDQLLNTLFQELKTGIQIVIKCWLKCQILMLEMENQVFCS